MVKKYSKGTFRHTKKKYCIKKGVNSKKRGLRGGDPNLIIDADHTLHGFRKKFALTSLNVDNCDPWIQKVDEYEKKNETNVKLAPPSQGYKDYYGCLNVLGRYVSFDTSLRTGMFTTPYPKTLTLKGCKAIKRSIIEINTQFKYEIFSPAATTEPPNGGSQQDTHIGTFTQLPISVLLQMAGQTPPFSFASFYNTDEKRKPYFSDYLLCLENVQQKFGPEVETKDLQSNTFRTESILRQFGKSEECKIVLVAGNIGIQIQNPDNNGSVFVGASQLNGAEYPTPKPVTDLNKYKDDLTAGPLLQLSCHPAVSEFIRIHAARTDFDSRFLIINAIDDVIKSIQKFRSITGMTLVLNNGYLQVSDDLGSINFTLSVSSKATQDIFDSFCGNLKVLQTDDVPTSGLRPPPKSRSDAEGYKEFNLSATSKVSLIYSSAVPLNYEYRLPSGDKTAINPEKSTLQYCVAGFDLVAQYFGSMVSAYNKKKQRESDVYVKAVNEMAEKAAEALNTEAYEEAQKKHTTAVQMFTDKVKLFLTPLGGGVFHNPREMIASSVLLAYYQAKQLFSDFDDKVEIIFLAWDRNNEEVYDFSKFFTPDKNAQEIVDKVESLKTRENEMKRETAAAAAEEAAAAAAAAQRHLDDNHPSKVPPSKLPGDGDDPDDDDDDAEPISLPTRLIRSTTLPKAAATLPEAEEEKEEAAATLPKAVEEILPETLGGSKSRRRHRRHRKPARKTRRGRKSKSKTHRRRNACKNKKYTRKH